MYITVYTLNQAKKSLGLFWCLTFIGESDAKSPHVCTAWPIEQHKSTIHVR